MYYMYILCVLLAKSLLCITSWE